MFYFVVFASFMTTAVLPHRCHRSTTPPSFLLLGLSFATFCLSRAVSLPLCERVSHWCIVSLCDPLPVRVFPASCIVSLCDSTPFPLSLVHSRFPIVRGGRVAMITAWTRLSPKYRKEVTGRVVVFPAAFGTRAPYRMESCLLAALLSVCCGY